MNFPSLQDLDNIVTWKPYTYDGTNCPSTGVLCKWKWGTIDFYDPRKHNGIVSGISFIEDDSSERLQPEQSEDDDTQYVDDLGGLVCTF